MHFVVYVTPWVSETAERALVAATRLRDVRVGLISQDPLSDFLPVIRNRVAVYRRIKSVNSSSELIGAIRSMVPAFGKVHRLVADSEETQVPLAETREMLNIDGMGLQEAVNFRDKFQMKQLLTSAGICCPRYCLATSGLAAVRFANSVGYPLVVKPRAGVRSEHTFRVDDKNSLSAAVERVNAASMNGALIEEYINGQEHSCESVVVQGEVLWQSITRYSPTPLEANREPGIPWCVLLPRNQNMARYGDIKATAKKVLNVLGMKNGIAHLEWFRRPDGSAVVSEAAARPPGAKIVELVSVAHESDFIKTWVELMVLGKYAPLPQRRFAAGAVFLRGRGSGRVQRVRGARSTLRELRSLVVEKQIPWAGQKSSTDYEGNGYIIVRHPTTRVVEQAMLKIGETVKIVN
jgi:hypothetical protein